MKECFDYAKGRDEAIIECIRTDSVQPFRDFIYGWRDSGHFPPSFTLPEDETLAISVRQLALHCINIAPEIKGQAVEWLLSRGHSLDITD